MRYGPVIAGLLFIMSGMQIAAAAAASTVSISNGQVRVVVEVAGLNVRETYFGKQKTGWRALLEGGSVLRPDPELRGDGAVVPNVSPEVTRLSPTSFRLLTHAGAALIEKVVRLLPGDPHPSVTVTCRITGRLKLNHLLSTYSFAPGGAEYQKYAPLDFIFSPQLRPEPEQVIADHVFRSPALMLQKGSDFVALVPEVASIDGRGRVCGRLRTCRSRLPRSLSSRSA